MPALLAGRFDNVDALLQHIPPTWDARAAVIVALARPRSPTTARTFTCPPTCPRPGHFVAVPSGRTRSCRSRDSSLSYNNSSLSVERQDHVPGDDKIVSGSRPRIPELFSIGARSASRRSDQRRASHHRRMTSRLNDAALVAIVLALRDIAGGAGTPEGERLHDQIRTALDNADLGHGFFDACPPGPQSPSRTVRSVR